MQINRYLDHAVLKPDMTPEEARAAIQVGLDYHVRTVCVRPCDIELAVEMCRGTDTEPICVLDFPHGAGGAAAKEALAKTYAGMGVTELDMVMNIGAARGGHWDVVADEVKRVVRVAHEKGLAVKVIFETCYLTVDQIKKATEVCADAGADFVKTSTGFGKGGATVEAVAAMIEAGRGRVKVKPSGGIRTLEDARRYVDMGASRLGVGFTTTPVLCDAEK